jgi:ADP-ribose pyrophosphatase
MRKTIYSGRIVNLGIESVVMLDGNKLELEIIRHPGAAAVVPVHEDGSVTLLRQYRHAVGRSVIEIPAGVLEPGEEPEECAARELAEEAQLAAGYLNGLVDIHTTPGFTDEKIHIFLARILTPTQGQPDPDEYLQPFRIPISQAILKIQYGEITDAKTICGLMMAYVWMQSSEWETLESDSDTGTS